MISLVIYFVRDTFSTCVQSLRQQSMILFLYVSETDVVVISAWHCRVADGKLSMSEAWERHTALLRRQHFGRDPPKYDPSQF